MPRGVPVCALLLALVASLAPGRLTSAHVAVRTIPVGAYPIAVVVDAPTHRAFVLSQNDYSVSILDLRAARVVRTVPLGSHAHLPQILAIAARAGTVFSINEGTNIDKPGTLSVLDARDGHLRATIAVVANPNGGAIDTRRGHLFVTGDNALAVLDVRSGRTLRRVSTGGNPQATVVDARADRVFVANNDDRTVSVFDAATLQPVRASAVGESPGTMAVDERSGHIVVCNLFGASLTMLDAASGQPLRTIALPGNPTDIALDAPGGRAVVSVQEARSATVVDTRTGRVVRTIHVGKDPIAVAADRGLAFVANIGDGTVSVLDMRAGRVLRSVPVGTGPDALAIDPQSHQVVVANRDANTVSIFPETP